MPYQTGIPAALRKYGLTVELVRGWETRGSSAFSPKGVVCHWTAGPLRGDRPSLRVVINGRPDLPGPLCQVFLTRAGVAVVVAAGRAQHAGSGGWRGLSGNAAVFGIEAESARGEWTDAQRWAYPRVVAALADLAGFDTSMVCGHSEWTTRKSDVNGYTMAAMRSQVAALRAGGTTGPAILDGGLVESLQRLVGAHPDGVWGEGTTRAVQAWLGVSVDGVFGPASTRALQTRVGATADGEWGAATTAALANFLTISDEENDMTPDQAAKLDAIYDTLMPGMAGVRFAGDVRLSLARVEAAIGTTTEQVAEAMRAAAARTDAGLTDEQIDKLAAALSPAVAGQLAVTPKEA